MATAWLLWPLPIVGAVTTAGTLQMGDGLYAFNDHAGVVCQLACDAAGNSAALRFDLGAATPLDTLMVFGLELLPTNAIVTVSTAQSTGGVYAQIATGAAYGGSQRPTSGKGVTVLEIPATTAQFIEVRYNAPGVGAAVRMSRICIGKRIQPERNYSFGAAFGVRDLGSLDFNARGVMSRRRGKRLRTAALTFASLYRDEVEGMTAPLLEQVGNTDLLALLTDPAPHAHRESRAYLGPLVGELSHVVRRPNAFEAKCNLVSLF